MTTGRHVSNYKKIPQFKAAHSNAKPSNSILLQYFVTLQWLREMFEAKCSKKEYGRTTVKVT